MELNAILASGDVDLSIFGSRAVVNHALPNNLTEAEIRAHWPAPHRGIFFLTDINGKSFLIFHDSVDDVFYYEKLTKAVL